MRAKLISHVGNFLVLKGVCRMPLTYSESLKLTVRICLDVIDLWSENQAFSQNLLEGVVGFGVGTKRAVNSYYVRAGVQ